ncbi:MAG: glycosyl hydrolase, partial [Saprospiraceae bacterium]|nr:glycosyl hydrolase [Saprospiraceae bacterium]
EVNSSRSSYSGTGVFKSTDGGKTWQHLGLGESHHIGRIVLHPTDPNTAWVAVLGHLYSPHPERGVFKTSDGGKTWRKVLYINDNAGAVDLMIDPADPKTLYAASWERERRAWNFVEGGAGSGLYKSSDGGEKWSKLPSIGFPTDSNAGRIGLAMFRTGGRRVLFAAIDNYTLRPKKEEDADALSKDQLRKMGKDEFLKLPKYKVKDYLSSNGFPEKYSADKIIEMVKSDKLKPSSLVEYTEDANAQLLSSEVIGLEIYRSDDDGRTWKRTHTDLIDDMYSSYGYYFGQIRVATYDVNKIFVLGVPVLRSDDGGKTFRSVNGDNVHADHHALWINPRRPGHIILGNDGGINISYDDGESWIKCNTPPLGQFYALAVDMAKPYNVYGGLQDNGVWFGPSNYRAGTEWHDSGQYPYKSIMGGDGMQVAVDTRDNATVYTGFQFGNYFRINTKSGDRKFITPKHELGEAPLRWNWQTPIWLSSHNQDILYMGANRLYRSLNQGNDFQPISPDLTTGGKKGDVPYGTLSSIHESPLRFGLLYTGSDDGLVHISRDGGATWNNISAGLPKDMWVSRVIASAHSESRVYVTLNGYRWDHFEPYIFSSDDYGKTWQKLGVNLPLEPINVVREDPKNPELLYVGTDHGLYISLNRGGSFMLLDNSLPATPVHDLVVHPRDAELVVGTHGRSLYVGRVKELQQLSAENQAKDLIVFEMDKMRASPRWGATGWWNSTKPSATIPLYVRNTGKISITVATESGIVLKTWTTDAGKGLNYIAYDLTIDASVLKSYNAWLNEKVKADEKPVVVQAAEDGKTYIYKGAYTVTVEKDGKSEKIKWTLE